MYQAKFLKQHDLVEEEVIIEVNGLELVGFSLDDNHRFLPNKIYPINLEFTILDDPEIVILKEPQYSVERIGEGFSYLICGLVHNDSIDIGHDINIKDDCFKFENLDYKFVRMRVDRISIEFI
ncbi:MAG: hypothetical protein V4501_02935 [Pseudomonadota bacterium]